ncbi:MAG: hypothetical protein HC822_28370 [Oscillochloris sp.]|nr:hypothetical protein [Oscillochloris sp.]
MHPRLIRWLRAYVLVVAICGFLLSARPAAAHPLGNFSINRYTRIEPANGAINLLTVVDFAEIPALQLREQIDRNGDGFLAAAEQDAYLQTFSAELRPLLDLRVDGRALPLTLDSSSLTFQNGQGGLETLRIELRLHAMLPADAGPWSVVFRDASFSNRPGWREVVVRAGSGMHLLSSDRPATDRSGELTVYPSALLDQVPTETTAQFRIAVGGVAQPAAPAPQASPRNDDQLSTLVQTAVGSTPGLLLALALALGLGAGHALTPGHGKTIVAAYLVGSRGSVGHAVFLGLTTTITHTIGVFGFGLITLFVSEFLLPEQLYPWLSACSGLLIVLLGGALLHQRLRSLGQPAIPEHQHTDLQPGALHSHGFGMHRHEPVDPAVSWRGLLALGVSGGLLPCPSALILLLGSIAVGRAGLGLLLVLAFSIGLAAVLTLIGVLLVRARSLFERLPIDGRVTRVIPLLSAAVVTVAGIGITLQAVLGLLYA